jgi:serine/threonine protein kinase
LEEGEGHFSPEFRDLFQKMVAYDPNDRISTEQILEHPWL